MHWGTDPALEKHYVPTRSQRARSVLTFFAQDSGTHNLVYANAELTKATQNREVIAFCDHWRTVSGHDPHLLVMDQKVTTQPVLAELDARGVRFLTLRMRSTALLRQINTLRPADYKTITLDRSGPHNRPRVHESTVKLSNYPATVRQFIITGLGRDTPTVIITNDTDSTAKQLITRYARRMTIEQRLAEIIRAFHADALSSTVNLNVDLDIMLCVLAQALLAALRARLPGYATVTPDVLQRRFLETPGQIITTPDAITVRLSGQPGVPLDSGAAASMLQARSMREMATSAQALRANPTNGLTANPVRPLGRRIMWCPMSPERRARHRGRHRPHPGREP